MKELTALEREVMTAILTSLVGGQAAVSSIISALIVAERSFSADVLDNARCIGFFSEFEANEVLAGVSDIPHHLGVQAAHNGLVAGGDFILFFDQETAGIKALEASFFGSTLPTKDLVSASHGFTIKAMPQG